MTTTIQPAAVEVTRPAAGLQYPGQIVNLGLSTSALFDMREANEVFSKEGEAAFMAHMRDNEDVPLAPGPAFGLAKKMLELNNMDEVVANITLLSHNNPRVAQRIHNSIKAHRLIYQGTNVRQITGEIYSKGRPITPDMLHAFGVDFFISTNADDVKSALEAGVPAAKVDPGLPPSASEHDIVFAFDFDRVVGIGVSPPNDDFTGDDEAYFKQTGSLKKYLERAAKNTAFPAAPGPLAPFFLKIIELRGHVAQQKEAKHKIIVALVTARTGDAAARALATFAAWDVETDITINSGNTVKANHLWAIQADFFADDGAHHIEAARGIAAACHVPWIEPRVA